MLSNDITSPPLHSKSHQGSVVEVLALASLVITLTTASCSMPALMLVRSSSSSVGTKAKPMLRCGFHWKQDPPKPIQPKKPALLWQNRSPSLTNLFFTFLLEEGKHQRQQVHLKKFEKILSNVHCLIIEDIKGLPVLVDSTLGEVSGGSVGSKA